MSIPQLIFFKSILLRKKWRGEGGLLFKNDTMVKPTNYIIARAGFTLRGALRHFKNFCNIFLPNVGKDQKKVSPSERGAPSWYCAILW